MSRASWYLVHGSRSPLQLGLELGIDELAGLLLFELRTGRCRDLAVLLGLGNQLIDESGILELLLLALQLAGLLGQGKIGLAGLLFKVLSRANRQGNGHHHRQGQQAGKHHHDPAQRGTPSGGMVEATAEQHQQQPHQGHRGLADQAVSDQGPERLQRPVPAGQQGQQVQTEEHDQGEAEPAEQVAQAAEGGGAHRMRSRQIEGTAQLYGR